MKYLTNFRKRWKPVWTRAWFLPTGTFRVTFLPRNHIKGNHDFSDLKMASVFYPEAYVFLPGNKQSTRIYGYAYG